MKKFKFATIHERYSKKSGTVRQRFSHPDLFDTEEEALSKVLDLYGSEERQYRYNKETRSGTVYWFNDNGVPNHVEFVIMRKTIKS